jgi:AP-4 complex subunit mu-1
MSVSQFYILTSRGDTIIKKDFRDELANTPEIFFRKMKFWEKGDCPPVFNVDGINYLFVKAKGGVCLPSECMRSLPRR